MARGGTPRVPQKLYEGYVFGPDGTIYTEEELIPADLCADLGWNED